MMARTRRVVISTRYGELLHVYIVTYTTTFADKHALGIKASITVPPLEAWSDAEYLPQSYHEDVQQGLEDTVLGLLHDLTAEDVEFLRATDTPRIVSAAAIIE